MNTLLRLGFLASLAFASHGARGCQQFVTIGAGNKRPGISGFA